MTSVRSFAIADNRMHIVATTSRPPTTRKRFSIPSVPVPRGMRHLSAVTCRNSANQSHRPCEPLRRPRRTSKRNCRPHATTSGLLTTVCCTAVRRPPTTTTATCVSIGCHDVMIPRIGQHIHARVGVVFYSCTVYSSVELFSWFPLIRRGTFTEVKARRSRLVLGWVTTREDRAL